MLACCLRVSQRIEDFWTHVCLQKVRYLDGEIATFDIHEMQKGFTMRLGEFTEKYAAYRKQRGHRDRMAPNTDSYKLVFLESRFMWLRENAREDIDGTNNFQSGDFILGLRSC